MADVRTDDPEGPGASLLSSEHARAGAKAEQGSYWQVIRTSLLIGGSSIFLIALGLLRTKVLAILLGPAGIGLVGTLTAISDLARTLFGLGINSSGVREIASASASTDNQRMLGTASVLRRVTWTLGLIAVVTMLAAAPAISIFTFGSENYRVAIGFIAFAVCIRLVADGQEALLNGLRRIGDIARIAILGSVLGTTATITIIYFFREPGIGPAILTTAGLALCASWWYRRRLKLPTISISTARLWVESRSLLKLGVSFMASAVIALGAAYAVRIVILDGFGLEAVGLYQAAWAIGGLYVGFILQAMGADFLPRLSAAAEVDSESSRIINEQALVSLLLAAPGVIFTISLATIALPILYTKSFVAAAHLLQWFTLGMALRVLIWPMSFILVARAKQALFFASDLLWGICYVGLTWLLTPSLGPEGAGVAFVISYAAYGLLIYPLIRRMISFRWSGTNRYVIASYLGAIVVVFTVSRTTDSLFGTAFGVTVGLVFSAFSVIYIAKLVPTEHVPRTVRRFLGVVRLTTSNS